MGRRWRFWPLTGFLTAAVLGTLAHFAYRWSGGALLAGVFILFRPELWRLLWGILGHPFSLGLLALSLALAAGFVFLGPAWVEERLDRLRHGK